MELVSRAQAETSSQGFAAPWLLDGGQHLAVNHPTQRPFP